MKLQKEIHEAAKAYIEEVIANKAFDVNFEEDNYDAGSLHATCEVCPMAFMAGADFVLHKLGSTEWDKAIANIAEYNEEQNVVYD